VESRPVEALSLSDDELADQAADRDPSTDGQLARGPSRAGRRARRFARLEVDLGPWTTLRSGAIAANLTVARYVGLVAETAVDRAARS